MSCKLEKNYNTENNFLNFLANSSEISRLILNYNWRNTSLGPIENWPISLLILLKFTLSSNAAIAIYVGPEALILYTEEWKPFLEINHPEALGEPASRACPEMWNIIQSSVQKIFETGEGVSEKIYNFRNSPYNCSLIPIKDSNEKVIAIFHMLVKPIFSETETLIEERLKISEEKLRLALFLAETGVWELDFKTGILSGDNTTCKLLGYPPGTLIDAKKRLDDIHPDDILERQLLFMKALETHTIYNNEYRAYWPDKSLHWIQSVGQALYDKSGQPLRMLGIISNITQRKKNEEKLKKALDARDEFLRIASHELKTPITVVKLQFHLIKRLVKLNLSSSKELTSFNNLIFLCEQQIEKLTELVQDMLDLSLIDSGTFMSTQREEVNLTGLISNVLDKFKTKLALQKCTVEFNIAEDIVGFLEKSHIEQLVSHLLSNIIKYAFGAHVKIFAIHSKSQVTIFFQDNGPGIPQDMQEKIFERFERATSFRNISGLGLGLYICKLIVEEQKGTIRVESEVGKGSTFIISLPLI